MSDSSIQDIEETLYSDSGNERRISDLGDILGDAPGSLREPFTNNGNQNSFLI